MMEVVLANLPALQVLLPLLTAPICFLVRKNGIAWLLAFVATLGSFVVAINLFEQVSNEGVLSYTMGGWEPPWGIEYRIDELSAFVLMLVSGIATVTLAFARKSIAKEIAPQSFALFYTALLLCLAGLLGITITGDAFNLFVFLEISSLSSYILISFGKDNRALTASFQYLIMGTIGATMLLIGIGFLYMMTGTLNMADLAARLPEVMDTNTVRAAFAFIIVGLSIKLALFPLHIWLPNAYGYAPSTVTVFLAATSTKVALYALLRFIFTIFGVEFAFGEMPLQFILIFLSVLAVFSGSLTAIFQTNIKHVLAYSSIAQIGYMMIGVALISVAGLSAGILHMFNHAIMKGCLFMALGCVYYRHGSARIEDFKGLGKTMPLTMAAFVVGGLGLIGMPLTAGFISKWYLVMAALEHGLAGAVIIFSVLAGSLLAVAYIWRVVEAAYFQAPGNDEKVEAPMALLIPTWALALATIYFGIDTQLSVGAATQAAESLMGGTP
ncbi:MAG: monovalent cation/H+ antiporter subunit D family protein [Alphaproteobacteria bacterium]|nr:monovalent cation/H+ antiporter subunit D family protein [Alphaproteobacteria bacterium]